MGRLRAHARASSNHYSLVRPFKSVSNTIIEYLISMQISLFWEIVVSLSPSKLFSLAFAIAILKIVHLTLD